MFTNARLPNAAKLSARPRSRPAASASGRSGEQAEPGRRVRAANTVAGIPAPPNLSFALHCSTQNIFFPETDRAPSAYSDGQHCAGFILSEVPMRILIIAAVFSALAVAPASAKAKATA